MDGMQDWRLGIVLALLVIGLIGGAHATATIPVSRRQWSWVWAVLVFLLWLLGGFRGLRA